MKYALTFLLILSSITAFAGDDKPTDKNKKDTVSSGDRAGNGGAPDGLEYSKEALSAIDEIEQMGFQDLKGVDLRGILTRTQILVIDKPIYVDVNGIKIPAAALNYRGPDGNTVLLNGEMIGNVKNTLIRKALFLHELLCIAGVEKTGIYTVSRQYLAKLNVPFAEDLFRPIDPEGNGYVTYKNSPAFLKYVDRLTKMGSARLFLEKQKQYAAVFGACGGGGTLVGTVAILDTLPGGGVIPDVLVRAIPSKGKKPDGEMVSLVGGNVIGGAAYTGITLIFDVIQIPMHGVDWDRYDIIDPGKEPVMKDIYGSTSYLKQELLDSPESPCQKAVARLNAVRTEKSSRTQGRELR